MSTTHQFLVSNFGVPFLSTHNTSCDVITEFRGHHHKWGPAMNDNGMWTHPLSLLKWELIWEEDSTVLKRGNSVKRLREGKDRTVRWVVTALGSSSEWHFDCVHARWLMMRLCPPILISTLAWLLHHYFLSIGIPLRVQGSRQRKQVFLYYLCDSCAQNMASHSLM